MKATMLSAGAMLAAMGVIAGATWAQSPPQPAGQTVRPPASLSLPTGRFGRTLGLPEDGKDLYIQDEEYIRFPLPPGNEAYADVDAMKVKATISEITAISRKSREDGNQYWGRIPGTPYDRMTEDWVMDQFQKLGLRDVHRQEIAMRPLWFPTSWSAGVTVNGKTI